MRDYDAWLTTEPDDDDERPEPSYEQDDDYTTTTEADITAAEDSYERSLERHWT